MRVPYCCALALTVAVAACAKSDAPADTAAAAAAAPAPPPAPAPISLADVAGTWNSVTRPTSGADTSSNISTMTATADTTGWTTTFPGGKPIALHVRADGDSIITTSDEYASLRRKGVKVVTTSVNRLQGGKLVGTGIARYKTTGPDTVMTFTVERTRTP